MTVSKDGVKLFVPACSKCAAVPTVIINERKAVTLADSLADLGQIDELHIIDATKAFVIGRSSNDMSHIILLDLVNGAVIDHFLCSRPTVSPDARRVAYVKFFTPHFVSDVSDEYLVYDSTLTPAQDRPTSVPLTDKWNVGIPLYPLGSQNLPGDNENVPGLSHFMTSDGFFWSSDSLKVAFTDTPLWNDLNMAVLADLSSLPPRVSAAAIGASTSIVECDGEFRGREIHAYSVRDIEFLPNKLHLSFSHQCQGKMNATDVEIQ